MIYKKGVKVKVRVINMGFDLIIVMKKIKKLIPFGILFVLAIGVICFVEKNPGNRFDVLQNETNESEQEENVLHVNGVSMEILSCEVIEGTEIQKQERYKPEWFKEGMLPDDTSEGMAEKTKYYFVTYKITNETGKKLNTSLGLDTFIASEESEYLAMRENCCYFDHAVNLTEEGREKCFFWYTFSEDEVLECVIGYEIRQVWSENETYYVGIQTPGVDYWTFENTTVIPLKETGSAYE